MRLVWVRQLCTWAKRVLRRSSRRPLPMPSLFWKPWEVILAWMLLWRASVASEKLNNGAKKKDVSFYQGQVQTAKFFINTVLPVTSGQMTAIQDFDGSAIEIEDVEFGGL
jgi:hypothetical protein